MNTESHGNTPRRVAGVVVAGIAVAVDIRGIGRKTAPSGRKPPPGHTFTDNNLYT